MTNKIYQIEIEGQPVYIGRTTQPLATRLKQHLKESETGQSPKCQLLRKALAEDMTVTIALLDDLATADAEYIWIDRISFSGIKLINSKEGDKGKKTDKKALRDQIAHGKRKKRGLCW